MSFLPLVAFIVALAMLSGRAAAATDCVCNYSANVDYFDTKLVPQFATHFNISYHNSYKVITVQTHNTYPDLIQHKTYIAYLCGTPVPQGVGGIAVEIPIKTVGLTSVTYLPYVNFLGMLPSVYFMNQKPSTMTSCMRKLYDEGQVQIETVGIWNAYHSYYAYYDIDSTSAKNISAQVGALSAFFYGRSDEVNTPEIVGNLFGNKTVSILMGETDEDISLGTFEWLYVMAALFNMEATAKVIADNVFARYTCNSNLVKAATIDGPKFIWGYFYDSTWYGVTCPSWECALVANANGTFLDTGTLTVDEFVANANVLAAEVIIYADFNWNMTSPYGNPPIYAGANVAKLNAVPAVAKHKVYDFLSTHYSEFFDNLKALPDVVLLDLIQVGFNDSFVPNRHRYYLRNVFTEVPVPFTDEPASACADPATPLNGGWLTGPCSTSGVPVNISYTQPDLCSTAPPTSAPRSSALATAAASAVVFAVLAFAAVAVAW